MSMYTTAQLLAVNEKKFKFEPLFLRIFFRESYPFSTEKVYLSQIPGLVNMALYVSPVISGRVIRSRGGTAPVQDATTTGTAIFLRTAPPRITRSWICAVV